jgi:hypothetical protein
VTHVDGPLAFRSGYFGKEEVPRRRGVSLPPGGVALAAALGVLLIAIAYTAGRHGYSNSKDADLAYWVGQLLIIAPVSICLLSRRSRRETGSIVAVVVLTVAEYLVKVCYSPLYFSYTDELSHWRTAEDILQTGKLFTVNNMLPISPRYPGLENAATAIVQITGLPLFISGLIVAGVAHLIFVVSLYLVFRSAAKSRRIAGMAIVLYSSNPSLAYFDSLFAYETLAIAFFGIALVAAYRLSRARTLGDCLGWGAVALLIIAATVVTHHVTSYLLAATFILISFSGVLRRDGATAARVGLIALWNLATIALWVILVAPQTTDYLWPPIDGVWQGFQSMVNGGLAGGPATAPSASPHIEQQIEILMALFLSGLLPFGWWQVWKARRGVASGAWVVALAIGSISWYIVLAVRLGTADGSELSGRASIFVFIPASFIAALTFRWAMDLFRWPRNLILLLGSFVGVLLMLIDGTLSGWPPYWERLPGPHQTGGVERSVGPEETTVAEWILAALGPNNRIAADFSNNAPLDSYGDQSPVLGDAFLFLAPSYGPSVERQAQLLAIHYVFVDQRITEQLPASGSYFFDDPNANAYRHPIPLVDVQKFDHAQGVARIFDDGNIVIYDLAGDN